MKKRTMISLIAMLTIFAAMLCACGSSSDGKAAKKQEENAMENADEAAADKSLYEHGMDVVHLMDEMLRSDEYLGLMSSATEMQEIAEEMRGGDYTEPKAAYKLAIPDDVVGTIMSILGEDPGVLDGFSDSLYEVINQKMTTAMITQINAQTGVNYLALSSIYTMGKTFVSKELTQDFIYVYTFENGYPICVTFTMGEGGAVTASGSFLMNKNVNLESLEDVEGLLEQIGLSLEIVEAEAVTTEAE